MMENEGFLENYPQEKCGVFGIYAPDMPVAEMTYLALLALQHRGQDGAGIAVGGEEGITVLKDRGLVTNVLDQGLALSGLGPAEFASGHVLYSTNATNTREQNFRAVQPMFSDMEGKVFTLSHNGHIINFQELQEEHPGAESVTDSELIMRLITEEASTGANLADSVGRTCKKLNGAFSLVIMGQQELIGIRDPNGFRPLILGLLPEGGYVLSSELSALNIVGAQMVREIEPGELIKIDKNEISSTYPFEPSNCKESLCAFEFVYFSRPDNELIGESMEEVRFRMGQELAKEAPVDADIVIGVPNSGISAAYGYVDVSKIPVKQGFTKNAYVGRSFISPSQKLREQAVHAKLNVNRRIVEGSRVVMVDDSIVRGTTTRIMVDMLREAGATEVHLRISSPPYKWPCFYGMNTGDINELIAASMTVDEIKTEMRVDSLAYLSINALQLSLGKAAGKVCMACVTGDYPTPIPSQLLIKRPKS